MISINFWAGGLNTFVVHHVPAISSHISFDSLFGPGI
jgi:hypothetical protein